MPVGLSDQLAGTRVDGDGLGLPAAGLTEHAVAGVARLISTVAVVGGLSVAGGIIVVTGVIALAKIVVVWLVAVGFGRNIAASAKTALDIVQKAHVRTSLCAVYGRTRLSYCKGWVKNHTP